MGDYASLEKDLVQVARLGAEGKDSDLRLLLARLVRRYRSKQPALAAELSVVLETANSASTQRTSRPTVERHDIAMQQAQDGALAILRRWEPVEVVQPVMHPSVRSSIEILLLERSRAEELKEHGLEPVASAIFVGPPGVGKTQSAKWIASRLQLPLFSLDLTAVMSSRLGQSGANLRYALDFAKGQPSVLFLDEIDSIAKKRADQADVGELKRLVTIMLQELDDWPASSLLLAATNHPELVDPALWRRFGAEIAFPMPESEEVRVAVHRFLGPDASSLKSYIPALERVFAGNSYSDIERSLTGIRRALALGLGDEEAVVGSLLREELGALSRSQKIDLAVDLVEHGNMSQHRVSRLTTVSRDTIRKRTSTSSEEVSGGQ